MDISFKDQTAIITGAGAGLGKAYALELSTRGAHVIVNDLNADAAQEVCDTIIKNGGSAAAHSGSVSDIDSVKEMISLALSKNNSCDILINNAGILRDKSFLKMSMDDFNQVLDVHLKGSFMVTQAALPHMKEKGYGRIVMTTSNAGLYGNFGQSNYGAAKMALVGFMNVLKQEVTKYDIKINAIAPIAATQMTEGVLPPNIIDLFKPELVSPAVTYLVSSEMKESGVIINAGAGWYSESRMVCTKGFIPADTSEDISAETIGANWETVRDMAGASGYNSAAETFGLMSEIFSRNQ